LRSFITQNVILEYFPTLGGNVVDWLVKGFQDSCFKLRPEWGFEPAQNTPIISDTLVDCLERGSIQSTGGIRRILGDTQVELEDGRTFDIDVLIWCTGYRSDFSMLEPCFDPTTHSTASWLGAGGSNGKPLARLYRNVFSLKKPDSLAFLGNVHFALSGFQIFDMASMAIAQVWKGASALPSLTVMEKAVDADHAWMGEVAKGTSNVSPGMVDGGKWLHAMDDLAGTGVNENLGYGWAGWVFWLNNRRLSNMLMGGLWSPHMHRLFDGKRRRWDGALKEVERVNGVATAAKSKDV
jgi:dimethylaniline monooxygenase (N-oxide forming)